MATEISNIQPIVSSLPIKKENNKNKEPEKTDSLDHIEPTKQAEQETAHSPKLSEAIREINHFVETSTRELKFKLLEDTGHTVITVIDQDSQKIIRQIPAEEVLKMAQILNELQNDPRRSSDVVNGLIVELKA